MTRILSKSPTTRLRTRPTVTPFLFSPRPPLHVCYADRPRYDDCTHYDDLYPRFRARRFC